MRVVRPNEYDTLLTSPLSFFLLIHPSIHHHIHSSIHPLPFLLIHSSTFSFHSGCCPTSEHKTLVRLRYITMTTRALAKVHLPSKHGTRGVSGYLTRFHRSPGKTTGLPGTGTWAVRSFPGTHTLKRSLFGAPTASRPSTIPFSSNWSRPALNNGFVNPLKGAGSIILTRGAHQSFAQREVDDVVSFYDDKVTQVRFFFKKNILYVTWCLSLHCFLKQRKKIYSHPGPPPLDAFAKV